MHVSQSAWTPGQSTPPQAADLVLAFGPSALMASPEAFAAVQAQHPGAHVVGASTGGEIGGRTVTDGSVALAAVTFRDTGVETVTCALVPGEADDALGRRLGAALPAADAQGRALAHVLVFADGVGLNGSALARGLEATLADGVGLTGGLAGDGARFATTPLWSGSALAKPSVVAVGLYGAALRVGVGAGTGWDRFGPERRVTRSDGNVLYELDGRSALDLYDQYLGPLAAEMPASGLRFPLGVRVPGQDYELVRTLLAIDREAGSMTFAGDVPEGATARLMRSNPDRLVDGAIDGARAAAAALGVPAELSLLVSCVGRRWTMDQRTEEEVEEAAAVLGAGATVGFYSYGELAPAAGGARCELHNQTLTITALAEV